jgi:hypothetical protein
MTDHEDRVEARPQTPQGPVEGQPETPRDEQRNLLVALAVGAAGSGLWKGVEAVGGRVIDQLRPQQPSVPPSGGEVTDGTDTSQQQPNVPPSGEVPGGTDTSPEWDWPSKG